MRYKDPNKKVYREPSFSLLDKLKVKWLTWRLPKLQRKANRLVVKESKAERKLRDLFAKQSKARRWRGE